MSHTVPPTSLKIWQTLLLVSVHPCKPLHWSSGRKNSKRAEPKSRRRVFILINSEAPLYIYLLFYLSFIWPLLFPSLCGYMACFYFKINTHVMAINVKVLWVMNEWTKLKCYIFHSKLPDPALKRYQLGTSWKCFPVCVGLQNKMRMFWE